MIYFIDEAGKQHGAIVACQKTKGVNGEKSLSGTIYTNDEILTGIGRGWRLRFEEETYCLTYVNPIDEGKRIVVEFDAVHEFFFDLKKSVVYSTLTGSNRAERYLQFIFNDSGYDYRLEVTIPAFEKENFGMKNRLDLFKDFISSTGVEFSVNGKIVRILEKVGTNLSTVVKKGFNLNELRIEKDSGAFITYLRGYGAFIDPEDETKGRLTVEYLSPLAEIYGKLEGDPVIDERYKVENNFIARLKNDVESSYGLSVDIDMEDLTKAGYEYDQPHEGDYIMAINKDLGFEQKIRIMSYTTSYDTEGNIIDHDISCGSDNIIQQKINEENEYRKEIQAGLENAISTANEAWISADGKNKVFQGPVQPVATNKGDIWYQEDGEQTIMNYWNGFDWVPFINPNVVKESITRAQNGLQEAKAQADSIQINVNRLSSDISTITRDVTTVSSKANEAYSKAQAVDGKVVSLVKSVDGFTGRLTAVENTSTSTTKKLNELEATVDGQKQTLVTVQTTANSALSRANILETSVTGVTRTLTEMESTATSALSKVNQIETTVNGVKSTVSVVKTTADSALNKVTQTETTVNGLKTTVSSVQTTANSALTKVMQVEQTASGIRQTVTEIQSDFNNLQVGGRNYFLNSAEEVTNNAASSSEFLNRQAWDMAPIIDQFGVDQYYTVSFELKSKIAGPINVYSQNGSGTRYNIGTKTIQATTEFVRYSFTFKPKLQSSTEAKALLAFYGTYGSGRTPTVRKIKFEVSSIPSDWTPAPEDMATSSQFTQLSDRINLKVTKGGVVSQIAVESGRTLIGSQNGKHGNYLLVTPDTTYIQNATIKTAHIADTSITTAKIVDAAITNAKIAFIDATKITTGYLSAQRIQARSITADKLAVNAIQVGFNEYSNVLKLNPYYLEFYNSNRLAGRLSQGGMEFWYGTRKIGHIGETAKEGNANVRGIAMNLENTGDFVTWGYKESSGASSYTSMLTLDPKGKFAGKSGVIIDSDLHLAKIKPNYSDAREFLEFSTVKYSNYVYSGLFNASRKSGVFMGGNWLYFLHDNTVFPMEEIQKVVYALKGLGRVCIPTNMANDGTANTWKTITL